VVKHAATDQVQLEVRQTNGAVIIQVTDHGRGFEVEKVWRQPKDEAGFGLLNIAAWLKLIGGRLDINTAPGQGSQITLVVPGSSPHDPFPPS
jgi:two-component system sensor histidine kinase UhpB